jgi:nicotinamide-nucleotide amidase
MHAVILSIGDELVLGQTVDTNSAWLSEQLARLGVLTLYHQSVADDQDWTARAITQATQAAALVLISGGLGPTEDDLTRQALAQAMHVDLIQDPASLKVIAGFFERRHRIMPQRNAVQALHPRGSVMIPNDHGTAPGIHAALPAPVEGGQAHVFIMPGVPREMQLMFNERVLPQLEQIIAGKASGGAILTTKLNTFGGGESSIAAKLGPLMDRTRNPKVGTTVAGGFVSVRVRSEFPSPSQAQRELDDTIAQATRCLGPLVFGRDDDTLQQAVVALLCEQGKTLAVAESCTGGLLGGMLTDVPGSSRVFVGGFITYANAMKTGQIGVPPDMIQKHGAVSAPTAAAMADGSLQRSGADLALAVTGIAGPDGGTPDKPVGTVFVALADRAKPDEPVVVRFLLSGDRTAIRDRAAKSALQLLRLHLLGVDLAALEWGTPVSRSGW